MSADPRTFHAFAASGGIFAARSRPDCPIVIWMNRRDFVGLAAGAVGATVLPRSSLLPLPPHSNRLLWEWSSPLSALSKNTYARCTSSASPLCFLSMDKYLGSFTPALATQYRDLLDKYQLTATTVEVVGPPPLQWNFMQGPSTIGVVPPKTRAARIDALRQVSDFAKR